MKTSIKSLALILVACVLSVVSVKAQSMEDQTSKSFTVGMYQTANTSKLNILIEKTEKKSLEIILRNKKGEIVSQEYVDQKPNTYRVIFDLSALEDGQYVFEIKNKKEKVIKEFNLSTKKQEPVEFDRVISMN